MVDHLVLSCHYRLGNPNRSTTSKKYDEHVNNHQVEFATAVKERYGNIIVVKNIKNLEKAILKYDRIVQSMSTEIENNNEVLMRS